LRGERNTWVEKCVVSPRENEPPIRLFFNPEKMARQQVADYHWWAFKKAMVQTQEADYLMDARDKVISCKFVPLGQLALQRAKGIYNIVWFQAGINAFMPKDK
jgi:hypothetical protein